ncbi:hypothetical protein OAA47_02810, partial [Methylophilaceae bacterium]|nr:hypothetical protein [Methylophilaceae bacterium]
MAQSKESNQELNKMIYFYLASTLIFFLILQYKKYRLNHPFYFFILFSVLYTVIPYYHSSLILFDIFPAAFSLTFSMAVIEERLFISTISVLSFIFLVTFSRAKSHELTLKLENNPDYHNNLSKTGVMLSGELSFLIFLLLYPIAVYFSYNYQWQDLNTVGYSFGFSVASHMKNFLVVIVIYSLNKISNKKILIMFLLFLILAVIDTQRTSFFIICLALIFYFRWSLKALLGMFIVTLITLVFIAVNRLNIDFSAEVFLFPIVAEATFGSYSLSQAIEIVNSGYNDLYFHARLFFSFFV